MKLEQFLFSRVLVVGHRNYALIFCGGLVKTVRMPYYAVARGREPGVYETWASCQENVLRFPNAKFKKFDSEKSALEYIKENGFNAGKRKAEVCVAEENNLCNTPRAFSTNVSSLNKTETAFSTQCSSNFENMCNKKMCLSKEPVQTSEDLAETSEASRLLRNDDFAYKGDIKLAECGRNNLVPSARSKLLQSATKPIAVGTLRSHANLKNASMKSESSESSLVKTSTNAVKWCSLPFRIDSEDYVQVYTDGACSNNGFTGAKAGVGVWFNDGHPLNVSEPVEGRATNNVAEIQAATRAVERAASAGIHKLCIVTDSKFMISCMTDWISKWRSNGWKTTTGDNVKNKPELIEFDKACSQFGMEIKWTHVRGHVGVHGNEQADALARAGAESYKDTNT